MNYFNPRHLAAFVGVVRCGSMVKAAQELHIGQPALSQAIANLERLAGFRLFDRSTRSLALTPAGKSFYEAARGVIEQHQRLTVHVRQWSQAQLGSVCLMSIPSVAQCLLPGTVRIFRREHPDVRIDVHDLPDPLLAREIQLGKGDLAIQTQGFHDADAVCLPLLQDPMRWIGAKKHRLARGSAVGPADLAAETLILLRRGSVFREMVEPLVQNHVALGKVTEVDQLSTLLSMVASGIGCSLIPALCCPAQGGIVHRPWRDAKLSRTLVLSRPAGRALMPAPRAFIRFMLLQLEQGALALPEGVVRLSPRKAELQALLDEEAG